MDWYAPLAKHIVHPLWAFKDGEKHLSILRRMEKSQYYSKDQLDELRLARLRAILEHAYENCPFYKDRFDQAGLSPASFTGYDDLMALPFTTKEDIQNHAERMVAQNLAASELMKDRTGGSTGKPLQYWRDKTRFHHLKAAAIRHDRWAGHDIGDKQAVIWGNRHDFSRAHELKARIRNTLLDRKLMLDSSFITDEKMASFVDAIRRFRPKTVLAYANSCALFARYLLDNNVTDLRVQSVITSAEMLNPDDRDAIETALHGRVFDRYGCREVGVIASECEAHNGLHINAENLYIEFVKDGRRVAPGEPGDIIVTDLLNFGMPFIRYRIEDVGVPADRVCECGRTLPMIETVAGRTTDFIVCPDGRRVSGAALTIYLVANTPGVRQAQIVQDEPGALRLRIVKGDAFSDDSVAFINEKAPEFFGSGMSVALEFVDEIPAEASGKYRFSICRLNKQSEGGQ